MSAAASESPIAISSTSPTPERPSLQAAHSSSSSIFAPTTTAGPSTFRPLVAPPRVEIGQDDPFNFPPVDPEHRGSPAPPPPRAVDPRRRSQPFVLVPTARPFRPRAQQGLAIPSRISSPASSNATAGSAAGNVIDLTEEDDDVQVTGVAGVPAAAAAAAAAEQPARPRGRRAGPNGPLWRDLRRIDEVAAQRGNEIRGFLNDPDIRRRRQVLSPPADPVLRIPRVRFDNEGAQMRERERAQIPPAPPLEPEPERRQIRFGGAVLRQGDRQINYDQPRANRAVREGVNNLPARANYRGAVGEQQARADLDADINERIQRRIRERDNGGYAGFGDILQGIMFGQQGEQGGQHGYGGLDRAGLMERVRQFRLGQGWLFGGGGDGGAGPAGMANQRRIDDPQTIIAQVPKFDYPPLPDGYTSNFEIDSTIEIDQPVSSKRYLACVFCVDPLLLSSGQKAPADRVWALRCGHLIDQKCLEKLSSPQSEDDRANINRPPLAGLPILGEDATAAPASEGRGGGGRKTKRPRPNTRKTANKPVEYEWTCPAKDCGHPHKSVLQDAEWIQVELEGALPLYA